MIDRLTCVQAAAPVTHCSHGHANTQLTMEFSSQGNTGNVSSAGWTRRIFLSTDTRMR